MKLTKTQKEVLKSADGPNGFSCVDDYKPARKLIELGLCSVKHESFGKITIFSTDAGRRALEADG